MCRPSYMVTVAKECSLPPPFPSHIDLDMPGRTALFALPQRYWLACTPCHEARRQPIQGDTKVPRRRNSAGIDFTSQSWCSSIARLLNLIQFHQIRISGVAQPWNASHCRYIPLTTTALSDNGLTQVIMNSKDSYSTTTSFGSTNYRTTELW